jgi:hypothetical protein
MLHLCACPPQRTSGWLNLSLYLSTEAHLKCTLHMSHPSVWACMCTPQRLLSSSLAKTLPWQQIQNERPSVGCVMFQSKQNMLSNITGSISENLIYKEWRLLGCYAMWLLWFLQEPHGVTWSLQKPHGVTSQKTPFFIVTRVKTSSLDIETQMGCSPCIVKGWKIWTDALPEENTDARTSCWLPEGDFSCARPLEEALRSEGCWPPDFRNVGPGSPVLRYCCAIYRWEPEYMLLFWYMFHRGSITYIII